MIYATYQASGIASELLVNRESRSLPTSRLLGTHRSNTHLECFRIADNPPAPEPTTPILDRFPVGIRQQRRVYRGSFESLAKVTLMASL